MFIVFSVSRRSLAYAAFTPERHLIYEGTCPLADSSPAGVKRVFESEVLAKVRGHGKVFTRVGFVVPFADAAHTAPRVANLSFLDSLATTQLRREVLLPLRSLLQAAQRAWPHLDHYFLFDTCLSQSIERHIAMPPLPYDAAQSLSVKPYLLYSYGHLANVTDVKEGKRVVSVYVSEKTSAAVFEGRVLRDAIVTYSPESAVMGLNAPGAFDAGFLVELAEKRKVSQLITLLRDEAGLLPMTESNHNLDTLIQIAGLAPRTEAKVIEGLSIESIEWIDLSVRSFIRALRHAIGALMANTEDVEAVIVNTSLIPEKSPLWPLVFKGGLGKVKVRYCDTSLLHAAAQDLIDLELT